MANPKECHSSNVKTRYSFIAVRIVKDYIKDHRDTHDLGTYVFKNWVDLSNIVEELKTEECKTNRNLKRWEFSSEQILVQKLVSAEEKENH